MKFWLIGMCLLRAPMIWGQTTLDLRTQSRNVDFSGAISTKPNRSGTILPATCSTGETFFKSTAAPGENLFGCTSTNTWTLLSKIELPAAAQAGQVLSYDGARWLAGLVTPAAIGAAATGHKHPLADLLGITGKNGTAPTLQSFGGGAVTANDCARFDVDGNLVSSGAPCATGQPAQNYSQQFLNTASVTLVHGLGLANVLVQCYDAGDRSVGFENATIADANTVVVTFAAAQSGRCVVNGTGGGDPIVAGDLTGTASNATVAKLAGRPLASTAPADEQVLRWNAAAWRWQPSDAASTATGTGLQQIGQTVAIDPAVVLSSLTYSDSWGFDGATVPQAGCSAARTIAAAGALTGDRVSTAIPAQLPMGLFVVAKVIAPAQLSYQVCNVSGAGVSLNEQTYQFSISRSF